MSPALTETAAVAKELRAEVGASGQELAGRLEGQIEAARSLGMTAGQALRKVTLPQAFRIMIPPLTNELIMLIKDSSLVFIVGLSAANFDLTKFGRAAANSNVNITPLVVAGLGYLIITLPLSILVRRMEAAAARGR